MRSYKLLTVFVAVAACWAGKKEKQPEPSALDRYIAEATGHAGTAGQNTATPGSLWSPSSRLTDMAFDLRARNVDDLVTILVVERASAVAKGSTKTARQSNAKASVSALAGIPSPVGALANMVGVSGDQQLDGQGQTSRETVLSTTLSARVTHVLPNGNLVVEGAKNVEVNSEHQLVTVRGVIRPFDLTTANVVRSDRLAQMEIRISGKGVVEDAIRRPFFLYRILLGILPF
jgi:flagellar L-ring protein precursor FlgH